MEEMSKAEQAREERRKQAAQRKADKKRSRTYDFK